LRPHADEKLIAFLELESAIRPWRRIFRRETCIISPAVALLNRFKKRASSCDAEHALEQAG
jgi:hypothetical protein